MSSSQRDGLADGRANGSSQALARLSTLLREEGGLIASLLDGANGDGPGPQESGQSPAKLAASGPRAQACPEEYELLVEAIYEGYLLHYGEPRVVRTAEADLCVLAGDRLYAIGLARLVALGDTAAVAELADTITLSALAQGASDAELAEAIWTAGARAVGWGSSEQHRRAKELVAAGEPAAIEAMRTSVPAAPGTP